ncbi:MAG: signal peptidase I, partial [Desulfovibrionaceae bacterium]|nr:signal peptidase I [Desulfovibrionaceae bacterium]
MPKISDFKSQDDLIYQAKNIDSNERSQQEIADIDKTLKSEVKSRKNLLIEYAQALGIALIIALFIRTFVVQAFKIPSESMLNTLLVGDQLLANKFIYGIKIPFTHKYLYRGSDPQVGDIVIFEYPEDPSTDFIKRVVGVPGDVIEVRDKQLYRNGNPVKEAYIRFSEPDSIMAKRDNFGPLTVPPGEYFMMGDNRDNSHDSRFWGCVKREAIIAKAWRIYWSWGPGGLGAIRFDRM